MAIALIFSNCSSPQEPFFRFNNPFEKNGFLGYKPSEESDTRIVALEEYDTPIDIDGQPIPSLAPEDTRTPVLPVSLTDNAANTSTQADTPAAPEIYVHKRGAPGSVCYTCRGKGYVLQANTHYTADQHVCPACDGDGRY